MGTSCTKKTLDNCLYSETGETCNQCKKGYYTDFTSGKCRLLSGGEAKIENCALYLLNNECSKCDEKFYLKEGKCVAVETEITDCLTYSGPSKCKECKNNLILKND